jgi:hypothetical protein
MKYFLLLNTVLIIACKNQSNQFDKYVGQLESLPTPLILKTIEYPEIKGQQNYDSALFTQYKLNDAQSVYGKIYDDDKMTGIIYTVAGDIGIPVLVTYDREGSKIDSVNLFSNASGFGLESEVYERVILLPNKTIHVFDSIVKWDLNKTADDRVEGSEKVFIDSFKFVVGRNGKISRHKD